MTTENNDIPNPKTPVKFSPLAHAVSLLGIVAIAGANEIYQNGIGNSLFVSTIPRILGAAIVPLFVGALVAALMKKRQSYSLFYGVAYFIALLPIMARI